MREIRFSPRDTSEPMEEFSPEVVGKRYVIRLKEIEQELLSRHH